MGEGEEWQEKNLNMYRRGMREAKQAENPEKDDNDGVLSQQTNELVIPDAHQLLSVTSDDLDKKSSSSNAVNDTPDREFGL